MFFARALATRVVEALAADLRLDDDEVAVECFERGDVVLRGRVARPIKRIEAAQTVRHVPGIRTVDDQSRRRPAGEGDREDARTGVAVLDAFIPGEALPAEAIIAIKAFDGTVTPRGFVDSPFPCHDGRVRRHARPRRRARSRQTEGPDGGRFDDVATRVGGAVGERAIVGADRLTVGPQHNVVTLSGTVRSRADRDVAVTAAAGATAVVDLVDNIRVLPSSD